MPDMDIVTNIGCRVQCDFCPQSVVMDSYEKRNQIEKITWGKPVLMTFETFKTCLEKIPKEVIISFSGFSEPFLNPHCTKMILYVSQRNYKISVYTTLVGMTLDDIEKIKHIPFEHFHVHLADIEKYAKIAVNEKYLDLLDSLVKNKIHNLTFMSMGNVPEKIAKVIGQTVPPSAMIDWAGHLEVGIKTKRKMGPLLCSMAHKNGRNTLDHNELLPNGDVCMCCQDWEQKYVFGNLLTNDYHSIFTSKKFLDQLQKMAEYDSDIICRNCNVAVSIKNGVDYSKTEFIFCHNCSQSFDKKDVAQYTEEGNAICSSCSKNSLVLENNIS